jgi:4-aminobutyrate aminotransferase-like enzyme
LGDPIRALQLKTIVETIKEEKLIENTVITGQFLQNQLNTLAVRVCEYHASHVHSLTHI